MYCKRILILQQSCVRFAERGKELCGLVKLINNGADTAVTVFVTNADTHALGEWWVILGFGRNYFARKLDTLNNAQFTLAAQPLERVSCLLVKREDRCYEAARAYLSENICDVLARQMEVLVQRETVEPASPSAYEQFVASTENFYQGVDIERLKLHADERYRSVTEYSNAFERFYATGGNADYYESVKNEIGRVFVQFPPYFPLIRRYPESFFVRIDFPSSDKYFVLGVLQSQGQVRYICYGLPADKQDISDKDFVYVDSSPAFWMLFQDATTGQISALKDV